MAFGLIAHETPRLESPHRNREEPPPRSPFPLRHGRYLAVKMVVEWFAALIMLPLAAPVILVAGLLVKLTSRGSAFYLQTRVGWRGRPFTIYKLRTMWHDCERESGPRWSNADDTRITPLGHFLRATHIDELPQLWNVLRGEMSLVGPRPERPEFVVTLEQAIPHYRDRLLVRPGVTGLAQVQLHADTNMESVRRKLSYDLYYVREVSLWLDLRILLCTAFKVFGVPFQTLQKLFWVPPAATIEHVYQSWETQDRGAAVQLLTS